MGSTYSSLFYHFVWGTKERRRLIGASWEARLHAWLGGSIRRLDAVADTVNGMEDHVHLLLSLRPKHAPAKIARDIKGGSSEWIHRELGVREFAWQDGYFVATVSPRQLDGVRRYIRNQKAHHMRVSWGEEIKSLLERAGISYDPEYL